MAIHLLMQSKTGLSAMELKRQLGVNYDTAWKLKYKLLQAMKESTPLEVSCSWKMCTGEANDAGESAAGKTPFVAAVA